MSIRYPESLVKKKWPEPTRWIRQSNARGFMVGKVVGYCRFYSSMTSVVTQWWIFLFLTVLVYSNRCEYDILKVLFEKIMPGPTLWVHHLLKCSALTKWPILHAILGHLSVRQRTCTCTFEVCKNVYLYMWEMYVKFQNLISTHRGLLGLPTIVETS